ncbi:MAG: DUF262 domain-containing protein [Lachnospiraceae bacterium]
MKKTTAKIIQISDIIQWNEKKELELSPKYQRNSVWNEKAKAYLIDTIIRGLPIPPIFLRQKTDITIKSTTREIIDGQQRIRAILEYIVDEGFSIKSAHNKEYGGKKYSELDEDAQEAMLDYEILAEVVTEKEESSIYDMFARLNSNNYVLNRQEIRNSKYWGDFKVFIYRLSAQYREFFLSRKLLGDNDCARMRDAELITSMIIVLKEGIVTESPAFVDNIYAKYDKSFDDIDIIEKKFNSVMDILIGIYDYLNGNWGCFENKNYFFTLYCTILNQMFGIPSFDLPRYNQFDDSSIKSNFSLLIAACIQFIHDYDTNITDKDNAHGLYYEFSEFAKHHKQRTTSKAERISRITFLNLNIGSILNDNE